MQKFILFLFIFASFIFAQEKSDSTLFVGSKNSDKYHNVECKWAKKIKADNLVKFKSAKEAARKQYVPCKVCKPASDNSTIKKEVKKKSPVTAGRCQATTKKGTQCKRKSKSGSQYCWQHK